MLHVPQLIEIAPGTILPGARQFVTKIFPDSLDDAIEIEIPGQILRCGDDYDYSVLPYARVIERDPVARAALITAQVRDERGLDDAMRTLRQTHGGKPATGFAIKLGSRRSFAASLDAAEAVEEGCDCEGAASTAHATLPGHISVGLRSDGEFNWTHPVLAKLVILADLYSGDGSFAFDCHSVWYGWSDRSTACEGHNKCPTGKDCRCDSGGRPKFNCTGWTTCWCK